MSDEYLLRIRELMRKHKLGFLYNPGGGEFTHRIKNTPSFQVPACGNNKEDYEALMLQLIAAGLEER